ncbi:MAG: leucine-rich repeat domain-containing protein, partial [Prevotella sp.]|nr:leucine-rich repeat domain-containing protein [Prevotella sp.]
AVQDLNKVFQKSSITSFDELRYFTGLSTIPQGNFWQCERMESIIIPVNVTKLGDWLFQECHNLSRLEVDENNKNYSSPAGSNAIVDNWNRLLYGCKNTIIPETVTSIYYCAFAFNNGITSIHIPASVNSITSSSFNDCANLNTITVDENNTTYDSRDNCNAIIKTDNNQIIVGANSTTIPKTITSIGSSAFSGRNLASISIPGNIKTIGSFAFTSCQNLKELYLEEGIEVIEEYAFQVCNALQQINIPSTVTSIGRNSFNGYQLRTINSAVTTPFAIENNVFHSNCYQLGTLYVPAGTKALYQQTDGWKQFKNIEETGDVPHPQLEMSVEVQNAVNGVIYEDKAYIKMSSEYTGEGPLDGSIFIKIYKLLDNGEKQELGGSKMSAWITGYQSYFYLDGEGKYKADCGYESEQGTQTVLGTTFFECRPDDRYVTIIMEDDMRTYCHEADLDFTDVQGLKAYTAGGFNTATNEALMMRVVDVPAQTGLLLVGAPGAYLAKKGTSSTVYVNMLKGVTKDTTIDRTEGSYFNYVFRDGEEGLGFYLANNNTSVSSHEAYLQLRYGVAGSRPIVKMVFDDITAISDIPSVGQPFDVYSLSGILLKRGATSLKALPAGIYIVNGRKVVNK